MSLSNKDSGSTPFLLSWKDVSVSIGLSEPVVAEAKKLLPTFQQWLKDPHVNEVELVLKFLKFSLTNGKPRLTVELYGWIGSVFLDGNSGQLGLGTTVTPEEAAGILDEAGRHCRPAFLDDPEIRSLVIFGGQACSSNLLEELSDILEAHSEIARPLFQSLACLLKQLAADTAANVFFPKGLDLELWIETGSFPSVEYQMAAPFSLPVIGLLQLLNYYVCLKKTGGSPEKLAERVVGCTGHSQGIVPAAMVALARTEGDFESGAQDAIKMLFWIGVRAQQVFSDETVLAETVAGLKVEDAGTPTPMLSVSGLSRQELEALLPAGCNIGLQNGPKRFVCSGHRMDLLGLVVALSKLKATGDETRVPFNQRKLHVTARFLQVSTAFHSGHLAPAVPLIMGDLKRWECSFFDSPSAPLFPIYETASGEPLVSNNISRRLVELICVHPVDWPNCIKDCTHVLDFGPGHAAGIGSLTARLVEGAGCQVVLAGTLDGRGKFPSQKELFDTHRSLPRQQSWKERFAPKIVEAAGKRWVETAFSRLTGKPPVMVAGMTPPTVSGKFVSAILEAGYHVELAGGGHFTEESLRAKIDEIIAKVGPSCSITLNSLFLNPRLWAIQYPLVKRMRQEGYPIEGLTIAAGVPSFESACEIVEALREAGLSHVGFKPGATQTILDVVKIAKACPGMTIVLQWTGGRAGGHHSFEDFHGPILETYAEIRSASNIVLVAGSGFGDGPGTLPYLTGEWSVAFGVPAMPFDGILIGSRMMVAAECEASSPVKELIVKVDGVAAEGQHWTESYSHPVGGVVTVRSELGEPIHMIATRGVLFWKELDETIFSLPPGEQRLAAIKQKRDYIIERLNADHQKVWFGRKADGRVCDLAEMTYEEVANRLVELCYVHHQQRWIDGTYTTLLEMFLRRVEERFMAEDSQVSVVQVHGASPSDDLRAFFSHYPAAQSTIVNIEDIQAFLSMCSIPWHKPVPFVPTLDDDKLEFWFKKDSLWQSEDVDAVIDQDVGRVAILHGPVAAQYSKAANESAKTILDRINQHYLHNLKGEVVAREEWFGGKPITYPFDLEVTCQVGQGSFKPNGAVSDEEWLELLSGPSKGWRRALLRSKYIMEDGKRLVPNRFALLFLPNPDHQATVNDTSLILQNGTGRTLVEARLINPNEILVSMFYDAEFEEGTRPIPLELVLQYCPQDPLHLLRNILAARSARVKEFYWAFWIRDQFKSRFEQVKATRLLDGFFETESTVDQEQVERFCRITGYQRRDQVPLDFHVPACWELMMMPLFSDDIKGDLLKLVHLTNKYEVVDPSVKLKVGAILKGHSRVTAVRQLANGKVIDVEAEVESDSKLILRLSRGFFIRDDLDPGVLFDLRNEADRVVRFKNQAERDIFLAKPFIHCGPIGDEVVISGIQKGTVGKRHILSAKISSGSTNGTIKYSEEHAVNAAWNYLLRCSQVKEVRRYFDHDGYELRRGSIVAPESNQVYSTCAFDHNPIHTNRLFAKFAGLAAPITHGVWTSTAVSGLLSDLQCHSCLVEYVDIVEPLAELEVVVRHIGMVEGRMILAVTVADSRTHRTVLKAEYEVYQQGVAYVFTGQGSQETGMGMDLYASSKAARDVWDRAEAHFQAKYGFSILQVVQQNPKTLTVHFGGARGAAIRENYMKLIYQTRDGLKTVQKPMFPEIHESSVSYTFQSLEGVLSLTQFTQPTLLLMEMAAFRDLKDKGLFNEHCYFAGHSLGEYSGLLSVAEVLSIESLCDIVFYRGMSIAVAVDRDEQGRSPYGMAAVNPTRVSPDFSEASLKSLVELISRTTGRLLDIVNYNVKGWQYVVAGEQVAIEVLTRVLNRLHDRWEGNLAQLITAIHEEFGAALYITTKRGVATIPLEGIDMPFHSRFLMGGVPPFRDFLQANMRPDKFEPAQLIGRYIPNLTAKPFQLDRAYVELVHHISGSPILADILGGWKEEDLQDEAKARGLGVALLGELLAFQLASPVRWIETQELMFGELGVRRFIEIGPSSTLSNMAERTLLREPELVSPAQRAQIKILSYSKDRDEIYYNYEDDQPVIPEDEPDAPVATPAPVAPAPQSVQPVAQSYEPIEELPLKAADLLQIVICQKGRKSPAEVQPTKSLKEIAGGKSTLQNEIIGELHKEFDFLPEQAEELPLADLGAAIEKQSSFNGTPGKVVSTMVSKMFSSKMPSGFTTSSAKAWLQAEFAVGSKAAESLFAIALLSEPEARFPSEDAAKSWLRTIVQDHFKSRGIEVLTGPTVASSGATGPAVSSAVLEQVQAQQRALLGKQLEIYAAYLGDRKQWDEADAELQAKVDEVKKLQDALDLYTSEHGQRYTEGVRPVFSAAKARLYDSWWNWARVEAGKMIAEGKLADPAMFANRADEDVLALLQYHLSKNQEYQQLVDIVKENLHTAPRFKPRGKLYKPSTHIDDAGRIVYAEVEKEGFTYKDYVEEMFKSEEPPFLNLRKQALDKLEGWQYDQAATKVYYAAMKSVVDEGQTFEGCNVLVTGAGSGSIGRAMLVDLLEGGARVVCTTSSYSKKTLDAYRGLYEQHGAKGSKLVVVPFNQASMQDIHSLMTYISSQLGWELDAVIPFAAISENGHGMAGGLEDGRSELAHRMMLTNVMRLLGAIAQDKQKRGIFTRPAQVILPLSPNHGDFGYDGMYGESKVALETLLTRWHSESWQDHLSIVGAVIGWTRGTALMNENNMVAEEVEKAGIRTFSTDEMALNLVALLTPPIKRLAQSSPVFASLVGGMTQFQELNVKAFAIRRAIRKRAASQATKHQEDLAVKAETASDDAVPVVSRRARMKFGFGLDAATSQFNPKLAELIDLTRTIVITGYGEVGPWGNSRTRWEMEATGVLSLEGCIELAWMMGLIRYEKHPKGGQMGGSWVDAETGQPVRELDVKAKYEEYILRHTGIRLVEPCMFEGFDPNRKLLTQEIVLQEELGPIEVSQAEADAFKAQHGDKLVVAKAEDGSCLIRFQPGCLLYVPKALQMDRFVAGQLPTGWDAGRYGIPKDIVDQVDRLTLFALVSTVEAMVKSGITDPYEFYKYIHVSELGKAPGSGAGGLHSLRGMYQKRFLDKPVQSDILQETFINNMASWLNLLLLSSAGPIIPPVGTCATAVQSMGIGVELILSGKAKIVIVGGHDDVIEEGMVEFGNMGATSVTTDELAKGREPAEMSRPMSSTRAGFMESQGAGNQVLMSAELAIRMGVPIYGIVAWTNTATDKQGKSFPAPGQGILTTAKSIRPAVPPRSLYMDFRLEQLRSAKESINAWFNKELLALQQQTRQDPAVLASKIKDLEMIADRRLSDEKRAWGTAEFAKGDTRIAPIEAALAVFGLGIDDIAMASFHGTSTKANDQNESDVLQKQLCHLGRTPGNMMPVVCQKYLTGHPKGASAAWMINGALQCMLDGVVPPNRNADSVDELLRKFNFVFHPHKPIRPRDKLKAVLLKSFGFGQIGTEVLLVHPDFVLCTLDQSTLEGYLEKRSKRERKAIQFQYEAMMGFNSGLVQPKDAPPYPDHLETQVYLNPSVRASFDGLTWTYTQATLDRANRAALADVTELAKSLQINQSTRGVGVDVQLISDVPLDPGFIQRNFTEAEIAYCSAQPEPLVSFAGKWAAKEAVIKALCSGADTKPSWLSGAGSPLAAIEVLPSASGAPLAIVNGEARKDLKLSISHSGSYAIAFAVLL